MAIEVLGAKGLRYFWLDRTGRIMQKQIAPPLWSHPHPTQCEYLFFNNEHKTIWGVKRETIACFRLNGHEIEAQTMFGISKLLDGAYLEEMIFAKVLQNGNFLLFCEMSQADRNQKSSFNKVIFESNEYGHVTLTSITPLDDDLKINEAASEQGFIMAKTELVMKYNQQIKFEKDDEDWEYMYEKIVFTDDGKINRTKISRNDFHSLQNRKEESIEFEFEQTGTATFTHISGKENKKWWNRGEGQLEWNLTTNQNPTGPEKIYNVIETSNNSSKPIMKAKTQSLEQRISNLEASIADIYAMLQNIRGSN